MRSDMKKVITERPRSGGGIKYPRGQRRAWQRCAIDDPPRHEGIRRKWTRYRKHFTDVLGPLHRFLLHQVGRPWNLVYSEVARNLPKTSLQNQHVYTHLWQFVETNVILVDRRPYYHGGLNHGLPIHSGRRYTQLYVHPVNGLLCKARQGDSPWELRRATPTYPPGVPIYPGVQYHKVNRVWYEALVEKYVQPADLDQSPHWGRVQDPVLGRVYQNVDQLYDVYRGAYLARSKRPLTKREVKYAGLEW